MIQVESLHRLTDDQFNKLSDLVFYHSGIVISNDKRTLLESRLSKRVRTLKLAGLSAYYQYLNENKDQELIHLLDVVTTNVTSFFRENSHFKILTDDLLVPKIQQIKQGNDKNELSIWSAGCSTGEEAISILISLLEVIDDDSINIKVLATDLSLKCLQAANSAKYSKHHFTKFSEIMLKKYFIEEDNYYVAKPVITSKITWRHFNLKNSFRFENKFDAIFCRNVMIYFNQAFRDSLVERFRNNLRSDGMLFVGLSESLNRKKLKLQYHSPSVYINKGI
ncbi:MAG: protein-glutamate O-methyltransferase CheR [Candidatus Cloacimonetes bacterium]|nr:protein-glutamate O-methyltransferase CheR [Candidatus Cloacimonadota bacterium]